MNLPRLLAKNITERLLSLNKVVVIYGARQTGKTTLAKQVITELKLKTLSINADQVKYIDVISSRDLNQIRALTDGYQLLFIDEAQRIPEIGINLKIIKDELPELKVLVTGSSSLNLSKGISESLAGRKFVYQLFPFSIEELSIIYNRFELNEKLGELLIYGAYPEVFTTTNANIKKELLFEIGESYLYKDIFDLSGLKHPFKLRDLLKLLAYQVGSQVSIHELSQNLRINQETVERYIRLLEQSFIIFRLSGFSRNLRKEVSKQDKFYFYDLGIRNMLIEDFKPLTFRNDKGELWENFLFIERQKHLHYNNIKLSTYYWRTYTGAELDYVEELESRLYGFEFKFNKKKGRNPKSWQETYNGSYEIINQDNYFNFIGL